MDGIVVAPDARGQGIGSELLRRVVAFARDSGFKQVRLDVVDTNPGARCLGCVAGSGLERPRSW